MHSEVSRHSHDLLDDLTAIVWEADPRTFQFLYVSRGAEALLGYSLQEWLSRPTFWVDLLHPDDRDVAVAECLDAVADGRDHDFEYRVVTADGSIRWLRDIVSVGVDEAGRAERLRGLMIDVTATRAAEASRVQAERFRRVVVAHGLDVTAITDATGTILFDSPSVETVLGLTPGERKGRSIFEMIHPDDAARMRSLFAAALSSGAATAPAQLRYRQTLGGRKPRAVVVDVNETVQTLRRILERLLAPVAVLGVETRARRPRVRIEGGALEQVLINLVVNARDAMGAEGRVQITTRNVRTAVPWAGHAVDAIHDFIEIEVADTGAGMTPEIRDRIFDLYFTTKDGTRGTGLATVDAIVRDAGGTITVDTEPGKGTTFRIRFPQMRSGSGQ